MNKQSLGLTAPAKVNLGLEIIDRRPDGYHSIATVVQQIRLHDLIEVESTETPSLRVSCPAIPAAENLAYRAGRLLSKYSDTAVGAEIRIRKRIPVASGLGGGASDAASTLCLLNQLWETGLNNAELCRVGFRTGADVPAILTGATTLATGLGQIVRPLRSPRRRWLLLMPMTHSLERKTALMYEQLRPADFTDGALVGEIAKSLDERGDFDECLMHNGLWNAATEVFLELQERAATFEQIAARPVHLAGSGPTTYCFFDRRVDAREAAVALRSRGIGVILSATI